VQVYRILGESAAQSRLDVVGTTGLTPLVGRDLEVALLLERWTQSQDGAGQVVLLRGEAGIGKSRLVEMLREHVRSEGATRIVFRCSPYHQNSALYPVIGHLQRFLQWQRDETPEAKFDKLEHALQTYHLPLEEVMPLLAALLSVPLPERYPPLTLTPQRQRQKTQEALVAWLLEEAERQPLLAVWEDLHWADPSTLDVLSLMLDQVSTAHMLTLLTCRPEFHPPWATHASMTQVTLNRLGRAQVEAMLSSLTGDKPLPTEVVEQVVAKTDGVPLFVEELVKMILESGLVWEQAGRYVLTGPLPPLAIPSTLHDSLMARLDRLSTARAMVQLGAVLGREFSYDLLQAVSPVDEMTLQQGLAQLVDAELVYQRGLPPRSRYIFKHALIQDAAYQSLLKNTRQQYHRRIAQVLEERFPNIAEAQPELLAQHYTEAGLVAQALPYWQRAGERATQRSANQEAIRHFTHGLELLAALLDTPERSQQELTLQTMLGTALVAVKGYKAPEVGQAYTRAYELCQQLGETFQVFPVLAGLRRFYTLQGAFPTGHELAERLLVLAHRVQNPVFLVEAHFAMGNNALFSGSVVRAHAHFEQGIALYNALQQRPHTSLYAQYAQDPGVSCLAYAAMTSWLLGYPHQALQRSQEALALAQELAHPYTLAFALGWAGIIHQFRREAQATYEQAEAVLALADEHGFPGWLEHGTFLRGWVLATRGQRQEGIASMHQSRLAGMVTMGPHYCALLAEAYGAGGQIAEGLAILVEAQDLVDKLGGHCYEVGLYQRKGELLRNAEWGGRRAELTVEECFRKALDIAYRQQAKSLELRTVMSLARLWQHQGRQHEARQLLAEIYEWFTEGFDTADLQEAKALLEELT